MRGWPDGGLHVFAHGTAPSQDRTLRADRRFVDTAATGP